MKGVRCCMKTEINMEDRFSTLEGILYFILLEDLIVGIKVLVPSYYIRVIDSDLS